MAESEKNISSMRWLKTSAQAQESTVAANDILNTTTTISGSEASSDIVVRRITASPRQVKTQIAKISYEPRHIKPPNKTDAEPVLKCTTHRIESATPPTTAQTTGENIQSPIKTAAQQRENQVQQEQFSKKKNERKKEILEIQNMLNEITKSPKKSEQIPQKIEQNFASKSDDLKQASINTDAPKENIIKKEFINKPSVGTRAGVAYSLHRAQTELQLERPKAATTRRREITRTNTNAAKVRSLSSHLPATKSSALLTECSRKKSYNPEEARRFMEEQKRKRRTNPTSDPLLQSDRNRKSALEKEQIKKRLEELRKNALKLVNKKVNKKRNAGNTLDGGKATLVDDASPRKTARIHEITFKQPNDRKSKNTNSNKLTDSSVQQDVRHDELSLDVQQTANNRTLDLKRQLPTEPTIKARSQAPKNSQIAPQTPLMENLQSKRIGLLRKTEFKDHSFSAIKEFSFDKENVALEMMTPQLTQPQESRLKEKDVTPREVSAEQMVDEQVLAPETAAANEPKAGDEAVEQLEPPSARLKVRNEKSTQIKESTSLLGLDNHAKTLASCNNKSTPASSADLPFWLKPSAVQVYPYNFIMAVRRKLEAIANPPQTLTVTNTNHKKAKKSVDTPLTSVPKERVAEAQQNVKRRLMQNCYEECEDAADNSQLTSQQAAVVVKTPEQQLNKSQTISDLRSNFSSISLQLPASNTVSEVSSLKSESVHNTPLKNKSSHKSEDDDSTTISSSVYNTSPEKKTHTKVDFKFAAPRAVSPLSLAQVEHLKIGSKSKLKATIAKKKISQSVDDELDVPQATLIRTPNDTTSLQEDVVETVGVNFNQLLDDFNRSLSQVIQVNEQLKCTLDKSHQIFSPKKRQQTPNDEYTSDDFEAASSAKDSSKVMATVVAERQQSLSRRKKSLFEIANVVKPLLSSPEIEMELASTSAGARAQQVKAAVTTPHLQLNLASVSNSGANSTISKEEFLESAASENDAASPQEFEKRLQVIEQLKANLKQSILNSQAQRSENNRSEESFNKRELLSKQACTNLHKQLQLNADVEAVTTETETIVTGNPNTPTCNASLVNSNSNTPKTKTFLVQNEHSNSPKSTTFTYHHHSQLNSNSHKSTEYASKTISEHIQNEYESPTKDNDNGNHTQYSPDNTRSTIHSRTPQHIDFDTSSKSAQEAFIRSHINNTRGDFLLDLDENAVSNETHFQAAIQAAALETKANTMQLSSSESGVAESAASIAPPSYNAVAPDNKNTQLTKYKSSAKSTISTQAIGSEIVAIFNQSDFELSIVSSHNDASLSESSLNYSSVGLYEKLIQTETTKSEHLTALLKMREKALLDRTKGQIAWLEVQKERYKAKGFLLQIAAIKKKQRGILLKMEKEREEIKRLLQSTSTTTTSTQSSTRAKVATIAVPQTPTKRRKDHQAQQQQHTPSVVPPSLLPTALPLSKSSRFTQQQYQRQNSAPNQTRSAPIVRANYELESSRSLEELLQRREEDLRKRREQVERLMQWHQRLDQEEAEVQQLERALYNNNAAQLPSPLPATDKPSLEKSPEKTPEKKRVAKMERRLKEIDKSLRDLSSISTTNSTNDDSTAAEEAVDFVRTTGVKLNKLWRRLTAQQIEKFEPTRRYKLCKADLERLYEEAKVTVLREFAQDEERIAAELLEKSATASNNSQMSAAIKVPCLNLNFSSGQSEQEEVEDAHANNLSQGNYSPSAAEEDFQLCSASSKTSLTAAASACESEYVPATTSSLGAVERTQRIERNVHKFMALTQRLVAQNSGLQRSLSDTQIGGVHLFAAPTTATSQRNISSEASYSQKSPSPVKTENDINEEEQQKSVDSAAADTLQSVQSLKTQSSPSTLQNSSINRLNEVANIPFTQISESATSRSTSNSAKSTASILQNVTAHLTNSTKCSEKPSTSIIASEIKSEDSPTRPIRMESVICSIGNTQPLVKSTASVSSSTNEFVPTLTVSSTPDETELTISSLQTSLMAANEPAPETSIKTDHSVNSTVPTVQTADYSVNRTVPTVAINDQSDVSRNTAPKGTYSAQVSTANISNSIASQLEKISAAVSQLSHSNSLPNYLATKSTELQALTTEAVFKVTPSKASSIEDEPNYSITTDDASYSCHFENISTDMHSPSGCTIKSTTQSQKSSNSELTNVASTTSNNTTNSPALTLQSKTFTSEQNPLSQSAAENRILDAYEADFDSSSSNETHIDDLSLPQFETTNETTQGDDDDELEREKSAPVNVEEENTILLDSNIKSLLLPPPPPPPPPPTVANTAVVNANNTPLMPDIINELEIRRCQQILLESDTLKQFEHVTAVPYMYVREIPNKPPPPYVPPAHGSPMTTIFPSEERIKDITYRRTKELYCEILKTDNTNEKGESLPSVLEEKITNIYERIILDICREFLNEHQEVLAQGDPSNFHSQLAFFNPPDRLRCIQQSIYKEVRRCLAMDKTPPKRTQVYSVYGQRAKRDHIGKIIIQEMYDEDDKWCNFHREENEVLELIVEEMIINELQLLSKEVLVAEGGTVEVTDEEEEENVSVQQSEDQLTEQTNEPSADENSTCVETPPPPASVNEPEKAHETAM